MRPKRFFTLHELVRLYKCQALSYIKASLPGYHHAAPSVLGAIDRVQRRFLREVGLRDEQALLDFNLAPLRCRRDIAMLGLLHRVALREAPSQLLPTSDPSHSAGDQVSYSTPFASAGGTYASHGNIQ